MRIYATKQTYLETVVAGIEDENEETSNNHTAHHEPACVGEVRGTYGKLHSSQLSRTRIDPLYRLNDQNVLPP